MTKLDWYLRANLKFRHLQLIVALDDLRNVGRVASYLNVSQPAISKTLAALEEGLGVKLFERAPHGLEPTEHGDCFVRHARQIIEQLAYARDELQYISEGRVTRVNLGVVPAAALQVARFIARLEAQTLAVTVTIQEATTVNLQKMLRAGDIDLIVGNLPIRPLGAEFTTELLYKDPIVIVVRQGHPLADAEVLDWSLLSKYPTVMPPEGSFTRTPLEDTLLRKGVKITHSSVESISTLTNIGVLQQTDSIGFLAKGIATYFEKLDVVSILPLSLSNIWMNVGVIWMTDRGLTKSQQKVRKLFQNPDVFD